MGVFKAYDIRGVYNKDWNKNTAYLVGFYLPGLLNTKEVLIGRDVRLSTPEIFEELCRGINDAGAHVADLGLSTTPMVYFFTTNDHRQSQSARVQWIKNFPDRIPACGI